MSRGGLPAAAKALVREGEVLETKRLAHEADLEVVWIHPDLGRHVLHIGYSNNGVVGHGSPFVPVRTDHTTEQWSTPRENSAAALGCGRDAVRRRQRRDAAPGARVRERAVEARAARADALAVGDAV